MTRTLAIRVVVAVVLAVFVVGTWVQNGSPDLALLKFFSAAAFACTVLFNVWDFWAWRLPLVQRFRQVPRDVRGTWRGTLTSLWVNPATGERPPPKTVFLVVEQTSSFVSVRLLTDESRSTSSLAGVAERDGSAFLAYLYLNEPNVLVEHRSRMHHGSTVLDISGRPARRLSGRFWTDRDSKGDLDLVERDGRLADDFTEAASYFTHVPAQDRSPDPVGEGL